MSDCNMVQQTTVRHLLTAGSELVLATHNKGKLHEFMQLMAPYNIRVRSAGEFQLDEPEETEDSFEGNAALKALAAAKATGLPALADDSGFCVVALDGLPGIYSARWSGPERDMHHAMKRVHDEMVASGNENQSACFVAVLCLAWPDGTKYFVRGECHGEVCWPPRGEYGHGYDPMFIPAAELRKYDKTARTFAEMGEDEKNHYSHRGIAFRKFIESCVVACG
ncbi:RdgB/HAM1 family non-canonical purine NTP pyrophosphatase [Acetobacteraceae bacterium ESL0709]|nr:RdgB/HAM1 family non-canonical purine NTP pyrophosphatase [Acetobacteraceae bacterium ESL0697]MDF7678844.1 RdgB/HAM1 family non-canonical purine NTP pyrophosphatase [Acetobacteraceae bacterium ESL0709]